MYHKRIPVQTNSQGICAFLGITFIIGYHVVHSWETTGPLNLISRCHILPIQTPRNRYKIIKNALYFSNNEKIHPRTDPYFI